MRSYRLAQATLIATFALIMVGGLVHSTGSALACPDWPLCYGSAFPAMEGGVFYEHGHRVTAGAVAGLTFILALALIFRWSGSARSLGILALGALLAQAAWLGRLGFRASAGHTDGLAGVLVLVGALSLAVAGLSWVLARTTGDPLPSVALAAGQIVVFQAGLGGLTVLMRLPTAVSTTHLATSMVFLGLMIYLVWALRPRFGPKARKTSNSNSGGSRRGVGVALAVVYLQMLGGALVRHTGSGLSCHLDLLGCGGGWPQVGPEYLVFFHRVAAIGVGLVVIWAAQRARGRGADHFCTLAQGLVLVQIGLGVFTVLSYISPPIATAHLVGGALLLADLWALFLSLGQPAFPPPPMTLEPMNTPVWRRVEGHHVG